MNESAAQVETRVNVRAGRSNIGNWFNAVSAVAIAFASLGLTSCSNPDVFEENATASRTETRSSNLPPLALSEAEAKAISAFDGVASKQKALAASTDLARSAFQQVLFDPGSVQFLQLRTGRNGSVCGKYNAKNRYGAYTGFKDFVVTKNKEAITSDHNDGIESATGSYFAAQYVADCATAKERSAYLTRVAPSDTQPSMSTSDEYWHDDVPAIQDEPDAILDAPAEEAEPEENPTS